MPSPSRHTPRPRSAWLASALSLIMLLFAGCPKPHVPVEEVPGAAGEFCIAVRDCATPLTCVEGSCCLDESCRPTCASLMEKDGTVPHAAVSRHPRMRGFFLRKCVALCCDGADATRIGAVIGAWSRALPATAPGLGDY